MFFFSIRCILLKETNKHKKAEPKQGTYDLKPKLRKRPETISAGLMRLKWFSVTADVILTYLCLYHLTLLCSKTLVLSQALKCQVVQIPEGRYEHVSFQSQLWCIPFLACFIFSTGVSLLSPFLKRGKEWNRVKGCRVKGSWSLLISFPQHNGGTSVSRSYWLLPSWENNINICSGNSK